MATTASSDASKSAATSPKASEIYEDENLEDVTDEEESEWSGTDTDEEEDQVEVKNTSTDIKGDLQRILSTDGFDLIGSFYASQAYPNAPKPIINVKGVGDIPLPFVEDGAKRLITMCEGELAGQAMVEKNVSDTWELGGSNVIFRDAARKTWLDTVALPSVYEKLGVSMQISKPRAELHKLFVYERGSGFLSHQDTVATPGVFGRMVILLPSTFTGGSLNLSHDGQHIVIAAPTDPSISTRVVAWYTDVTHAFNPVQSGYRLALFYNLLHTTALSLAPEINVNSHLKELKHVLLSWKQRNRPSKLIYIMDHLYSSLDLSVPLLRGKDKCLVSRLHPVARRLGFHLCVVNLELHQFGSVEKRRQSDHFKNFGRSQCYYDGFRGYDEDSDEDSDKGSDDFDNYTMAEVEEETWSFSDASDMHGFSVDLNKDLDLTDRSQYFPYGLDATDPDEKELDECTGRVRYRRSAVLIWSARRDLEVAVKDVSNYAEQKLNQNNSEKATAKERRIAENLFNWCRSHSANEAVARALRSAAVRWKEASLWLRACKVAKLDYKMDVIDSVRMVEEVKVFGFGPLTEFLTSTIEHNMSDEPRFRLLSGLKSLADQNSDTPLLQWIEIQEDKVLRSLRMADPKGISHCVAAAQKHGCLYLQKKILPQLITYKPPPAFWQSFAIALREVKSTFLSNVEDADKAIRSIVEQQISATDPFPVKATSKSPSEVRTADLGTWIAAVKESASLGSLALQSCFKRMLATWDKMPVPEKTWVARNFLPGAIDCLAEWETSCMPPRSPGDETLQCFWTMSLFCYLQHFEDHPTQLSKALYWCGDFGKLKDRVGSFIKNLVTYSSTSVQKLVKHTYKLSVQKQASDEALAASFNLLACISANTLALHAPLGRPSVYGLATDPRPDVNVVSGLIRTLLHCNFVQQFETVLQRVLKFSTEMQHLNGCLVPILRSSIEELRSLRMSWPSQPLSNFASAVISGMVKHTGPKPLVALTAAQLESLGCGCAQCLEVRSFAGGKQRTLSIRAVQDRRTHVEHQLGTKAKAWGFTWTTIRTGRGSPHVLEIKKPAGFGAKKTWAEGKQQIVEAMALLGPASTQADILGPQWTEVCTILQLDGLDKKLVPVTSNASAVATKRPKQIKAKKPRPAATSAIPETHSAPLRMQATKRTHQQAMGSEESAPAAKRSKAIEIIDLSE